MLPLAALLLLLLLPLLSRGVGRSREQPEDDVHSAVFVVTQDGLNNAPELYSQFLADAIADANDQVRISQPL